MSELKNDQLKSPEEETLERTKKLQENARAVLGKIFDEEPDTARRLKKIASILEPTLNSPLLHDVMSDEEIHVLSGSQQKEDIPETRDEFIQATEAPLQTLLKARAEYPKIFEDIFAQTSMKEAGFTPLNERISYHRENGSVFLRLAEARQVKDRLINLFHDGFKKLAPVVASDPSIIRIAIVSWINATNTYGSMLEHFGFTDEGEISDEERKKFFPHEHRPIKSASMGRDVFLSRYLNPQEKEKENS